MKLNCDYVIILRFLFLGFDSDDLVPPGKDEIKDNQWLGVTVRSQGVGGKVMVCVIALCIIYHFTLYCNVTNNTFLLIHFIKGMRSSTYS